MIQIVEDYQGDTGTVITAQVDGLLWTVVINDEDENRTVVVSPTGRLLVLDLFMPDHALKTGIERTYHKIATSITEELYG